MTIDLNDILNHIAANPDAARHLQQILNTPKVPARFSCPDLNSLTLLQATFFDNGPKDQRRSHTAEYAVTIEAWTTDKANIRLDKWDWKKSIPLIAYDQFEKRLSGLLSKATITKQYYDTLYTLWEGLEQPPDSSEQHMFGLIGDKGSKDGPKGTNYYPDQFVIAHMSGRQIKSLAISNGPNDLLLSNFDDKDMKGQFLKGAAKRQSRLDLCVFYPDWGTE
jgi:hypothetical protein